jgi:hypothetical protein
MASTPWVFIPGARGDASARDDSDTLESLILRVPFVGADVVARAADAERSNSITSGVALTPAVARRALVAERGWPEDVDTLHRWAREGSLVYAIEPAPH